MAPDFKRLGEAIASSGVVMSEYPPGTRPSSYHFPVRNRIISGISQATVVVEAGIGSGSLITAKNAILQGRDVFALPANVGSKGAEGTNGLLRDGANLALSSNDVIEPYRCVYAETLRPEKMKRIESVEQIDLSYLAELGVIELSQKKSPTPEKREAVTATPRKKQEKTKKVPRDAPQKEAVQREVPVREEPPRQSVQEERSPSADAVLSSLSEVQTAILKAIPDDESVAADTLCNLGYPYGEIIAALTMLEIMGLLQKLPGSLYKKA